MKGVFVTGTGTEVGKTVVAAVLTKALGADYWKPIQTGLEEADDSAEVKRLTGARTHRPGCELQAPLSPHEAARLENVTIQIQNLRPPATDGRALVVEGAGGVLVPINDKIMMIDLIARLGLPVVLVTLSGLGAINHTLLSLEAMRARGLPILGVVMNGPANPANRLAIEIYGQVSVLAEIPRAASLDAQAITRMAADLSCSLKEKLP